MRLEQRLEFKLSPLLIERLDLLTLSQLELRQLIEQKIEQNPFLEKESEDEELPLPEDKDDWDTYPQSVEYKPEDKQKLPITSFPITLKESLLDQLRLAVKNPKLIKIGEHIIYSLDEDGYLRASTEEISKSLNEDTEIVEMMVNEIQNFDPLGVAARSLQECLLIQLKSKRPLPKTALNIVEHSLKDFLNGNYKKVMQTLKISESRLKTAIQCIKSCRPKPGKTQGGHVRYILPDVIIERQAKEWVAYLADVWLPKLRLSSFYQKIRRNVSKLKKVELEYLRKKENEAKFLLQGIEKRRETITKISKYIVKREKDFLNHKSNSITFLTLQEVAQAIGRDPSTVSRAIKEKWIQTPKGALKFKSFFSGGKIKKYPEIAHKIKDLINKENKSNPLKDAEILKILQKENFKIARTTIVKYRNRLGILNSNKRKVY
ncbi:RNA polymerase factor sigma-54 [candidate division WOR-3 bacterium]|nr:RNA polymerase factor sigma-54 [candidate division WOR-3 bacterium]